jgi:hypothetical protein
LAARATAVTAFGSATPAPFRSLHEGLLLGAMVVGDAAGSCPAARPHCLYLDKSAAYDRTIRIGRSCIPNWTPLDSEMADEASGVSGKPPPGGRQAGGFRCIFSEAIFGLQKFPL